MGRGRVAGMEREVEENSFFGVVDGGGLVSGARGSGNTFVKERGKDFGGVATDAESSVEGTN